ncbi:MAG: hypothetical protein GY795_10650 [Desulfobacterales bacterium]|nr:hypothetical protein [Desulfobacterales bacterium]
MQKTSKAIFCRAALCEKRKSASLIFRTPECSDIVFEMGVLSENKKQDNRVKIMNNKIPERFPLTVVDRGVSALFSNMGDIMLQVEIEFSNQLDPDRLRQALQLVLDAEPVLGCRLVFHPHRPYWERLPDNERENFSVFNSKTEYEQAKNATLDPKIGPAVRGVLLSASECDTLLLKIVHEVADSGGTKDIAYLVASIYNKLGKNPDYKPKPNLIGTRGIKQVLRKIPLYALPRIFFNYLTELRTIATPRRSYNPQGPGTTEGRNYTKRYLPRERVRRIAEFGRQHNAKINDMILAAFFRALMHTGWDRHSQLRIGMTVDLRRWYMPDGRAEAVCNMSGTEVCVLGTDPGENLKDTLEKVVSFTSHRKKSWFGLNLYGGPILFTFWMSYQMLNSFFKKTIENGLKNKAIFPIFTNLGPIEEQYLVFDEKPDSACIIAPAGYPPFFGFGISGYSGSLTLTAGTFSSSRNKIEKIFDTMLEELPD